MSNLPATTNGGNTPFLMDNPVFDAGQFQNMLAVAEVMSKAKLVPEHLQNKTSDCFLVVEQARRWNMSPFAVAQETYLVKGKLLFSGKLTTAVVNSLAPVKAPLAFTFEGSGDATIVTASATLKGEDEPRTYSIAIKDAKAVAGHSSLWRTDPKQQVCYFAARFWARRHCPEVILGVWGEDEVHDIGPDTARDITPANPGQSAPSIRDQLLAQAAAPMDEPIEDSGYDADTGEILDERPTYPLGDDRYTASDWLMEADIQRRTLSNGELQAWVDANRETWRQIAADDPDQKFAVKALVEGINQQVTRGKAEQPALID